MRFGRLDDLERVAAGRQGEVVGAGCRATHGLDIRGTGGVAEAGTCQRSVGSAPDALQQGDVVAVARAGDLVEEVLLGILNAGCDFGFGFSAIMILAGDFSLCGNRASPSVLTVPSCRYRCEAAYDLDVSWTARLTIARTRERWDREMARKSAGTDTDVGQIESVANPQRRVGAS